MRNFSKLVVVALCIVTFVSCATTKKTTYFRDLAPGQIEGQVTYESVITPGDLLSIIVSGATPEAVAVFNLPVVTQQSVGSTMMSTNPLLQLYLVDDKGEVNFPVLGKLKLGGLKKSEATVLIESQLKAYATDPIVTIEYRNYRITVLGEVQQPGSYTINNEHVSLLEALGMAGDMTIYGRRDNVLLIRENNDGTKTFARIDMTSTELMTSPYYFLNKNDVLYIEPNRTRVSSAASVNVGIYLSAVSTLASTVTVIVAVLNMK